MKCDICTRNAESHVLFRRENSTEAGFLAFDDAVTFDNGEIGRFVYYLAEEGFHAGRRGVVDLCHRHLVAARANSN